MSADDPAALPAPLQDAYRRLIDKTNRMVQMRLVGARPADLRYGIEIGLTISDVLAQVMIRAGLLTQDEYEALLVASLEERADTFERRIQARLDSKKDMPR